MNKINDLNPIDKELLIKKYGSLDKIKDQIESNYPIQYLIGNVNFYGYDFLCDERVLIPRFETEGLIEKTISYLKELKLDNAKVLDMGTGSGCIAITLKKELPNIQVKAIDISNDALDVARLNAKNLDVSIAFELADIFKYESKDKYDLLIANPPYIAFNEEVDESIKYEPKQAIYAEDNGLIFYKHILKIAPKILNDKSLIAMEIGYQQGSVLKTYAKEYFPNAKIIISKDLASKDRYLFIINE